MSNRSSDDEPWASLVKIPADVDKEDTVLGPLTARQSVQLAGVLFVLWIGYHAARDLVPPLFYAAAALPVATCATLAVLTRRDGLPLDGWLLAALRHRRAPKRLVPDGGLADVLPWQAGILAEQQLRGGIGRLCLPIADVGSDGVLDVADGRRVALSRAGTVNFGLRTAAEQQVLVSGFARWLNALTGPVQILVRTQPLEIGSSIADLEQAAPALPHPLLEVACREHAAFLASLASEQDLLTRQVLLSHREAGTDRAAELRALRRAEEAAGLLAAAEIPVQSLSASEAFAQLAAATAPDTPLHPDLALPHLQVTCHEEGGAW